MNDRQSVHSLLCDWAGLRIPYCQFGNVDSLDILSSSNELLIFDFYRRKKDRYNRALDIGANIGIHSILMARQGWDVMAFEPDPLTFELLSRNVRANYMFVNLRQAAVSDRDGKQEFVRVLGNTTSSHLAGDKEPYGETQTLEVETVDVRPLFKWADFAKIDCEGHEAKLICSVPAETVPDAIVEIGNRENADKIFWHLIGQRKMFSQKTGWKKVNKPGDMPTSYKEGSLLISESPWRE